MVCITSQGRLLTCQLLEIFSGMEPRHTLCESCAEDRAVGRCAACPAGVHLYCQECFDGGHKKGQKKTHVLEPFGQVEESQEGLENDLAAPAKVSPNKRRKPTLTELSDLTRLQEEKAPDAKRMAQTLKEQFAASVRPRTRLAGRAQWRDNSGCAQGKLCGAGGRCGEAGRLRDGKFEGHAGQPADAGFAGPGEVYALAHGGWQVYRKVSE